MCQQKYHILILTYRVTIDWSSDVGSQFEVLIPQVELQKDHGTSRGHGFGIDRIREMFKNPAALVWQDRGVTSPNTFLILY